ncbi:hypothetical protein [Kordiimonas laminariae]|uniref:hypothetical protein n=1 Tax=Kordiimonas laminariae TaxID=2917717 RepID=UPI001FF4955F|nr:hypothetical protein [Kordiimonas laminariae]MCK0069953.1 hypothetical protein [Kordiimonas laminariae]
MNEHAPIPDPLPADSPELEKYRHHLDEFDLTEEQKQELLVTLWQIMTQFVDLGFGRDATTLALKAICGEDFEPAPLDDEYDLYLKDKLTTESEDK